VTAELLETELRGPVEFVLRSVQVENLEVPFLWAYRTDYLHPLMTREHLWQMLALDEQWEALYMVKQRLKHLITALSDAAVGSPEEDVSVLCSFGALDMRTFILI
jgi:transcriptional accessory protein Tex/SPT6